MCPGLLAAGEALPSRCHCPLQGAEHLPVAAAHGSPAPLRVVGVCGEGGGEAAAQSSKIKGGRGGERGAARTRNGGGGRASGDPERGAGRQGGGLGARCSRYLGMSESRNCLQDTNNHRLVSCGRGCGAGGGQAGAAEGLPWGAQARPWSGHGRPRWAKHGASWHCPGLRPRGTAQVRAAQAGAAAAGEERAKEPGWGAGKAESLGAPRSAGRAGRLQPSVQRDPLVCSENPSKMQRRVRARGWRRVGTSLLRTIPQVTDPYRPLSHTRGCSAASRLSSLPPAFSGLSSPPAVGKPQPQRPPTPCLCHSSSLP